MENCRFCGKHTSNVRDTGPAVCDKCNSMLEIGLFPPSGIDAQTKDELEGENR